MTNQEPESKNWRKRSLRVPIILAVIAVGFYVLSIYMQFQQSGTN